jgi:hypothetical protein
VGEGLNEQVNRVEGGGVWKGSVVSKSFEVGEKTVRIERQKFGGKLIKRGYDRSGGGVGPRLGEFRRALWRVPVAWVGLG